MTISETMKEIHANNVEKGFWEVRRNTGEMLMLVVSELSEALEADRKKDKFVMSRSGMLNMMGQDNPQFLDFFKTHVKDTFEDEIADAVIRLFDLAEGMNIDLEWHIAAKMRYNKTRPYKHNKAY